MSDRSARSPEESPRTRRWRAGLHLGVVLLAGCAWLGCSPQTKYRVLSTFFDGVPDPNAPQVAAAQGPGDAPGGVYKSPIVSSHAPFVRQDCTACHVSSPLANTVGVGIQTSLNADVCLKCHDRILTQFPVMHAPVAATACLWCHNPHESTQPKLLKLAGAELCMQCHDRTLLSPKPPEHLQDNSACLDCHDGHGGAQHKLLRPNVIPFNSPASTTRHAIDLSPAPSVVQSFRGAAPATRPATRPAAAAAAAAAAPLVSSSERRGANPTTRPYFLASAPDANAGGGGPIVIERRRQTDLFTLGAVTGHLDFRYLLESDSLKSVGVAGGGNRDTFRENRFEEEVGLDTTASIVHPNLAYLTLSGTFGLRQDLISQNGSNANEDEQIYNYDVNALFLRKEEAPITLYSRRYTETIGRQFGPSLDSTITTSGAIVDWQNKVVPTRLEYYHTNQDQRALDGSQSFSLDQDSVNLHSDYRPTEFQRLTFNYTFNSITQHSKAAGVIVEPLATSFDIHDLSLTHTADFGANRGGNLTSFVNFFDQIGDFPLERFRWDERLRIRHTPTFETRYQYDLDYQSSTFPGFGSVEQTQHSFVAGLTHWLYKSLVSSANAGVRKLDLSDGGGTFGYLANANLDYHKLVPFGRLGASLGYAFDRQRNEAQSGGSRVINQAFTFNDPSPVLLFGGNILEASIVLRDSSGTVIYIEGLDYEVRTFPQDVQISRVIGGRIANGQTVLVSYELAPQPANTVTNNVYTASVRYDFQRGALAGLGVYGRFLRLNQGIDSDRPTLFTPNSVTEYVAGGDYRWRSFTFGAEHEWHESDIAPFEASRFYARYDRRFGASDSLALYTNYSIYDYFQDNNHVELWTTGGTLLHRFSTELSASATVQYLNQRDRLFGGTNGVEGNVGLQWKHRQTSAYVQLRESFLDTRAQESRFQTLWVGVRREF